MKYNANEMTHVRVPSGIRSVGYFCQYNWEKGNTKDEDPSPAKIATHPVHLPNGGGQQATKGTSQAGTTEEEGVTLLSLRALIPHAN